MRLRILLAALVATLAAAPGLAKDDAACAASLVCASDPQTVFAAMEKAGLKPKLTTDGDGDPMIESDEDAYHYDVYFYGCENHKGCDSLRFQSSFVKEPENTATLANKWNAKKRFLQAFINDSGEFVVGYDVSTVGGLNQSNFADVLDWWSTMLGALVTFFKEEVPPPATKP